MTREEHLIRIADIVYGLLETQPLYVHDRVLGFTLEGEGQEGAFLVYCKGEWCVSFGGLNIPLHFNDEEVTAYVEELIRRYRLVFEPPK